MLRAARIFFFWFLVPSKACSKVRMRRPMNFRVHRWQHHAWEPSLRYTDIVFLFPHGTRYFTGTVPANTAASSSICLS